MIVTMDELVWHDDTKKELLAFIHQPTQALLISGEKGIGKLSTAEVLIKKILNLKGEIDSYPYLMHIIPDGRLIKVEVIRQIDQFLKLKVPKSTNGINRIVLIESADSMHPSAQNASLKLLEEPPEGSLFILLTENLNALLPTVISRTNNIRIRKPLADKMIEYFKSTGYDEQQIETALLLSDRLPGMTAQILQDPKNHQLFGAAGYAKRILAGSDYERLVIINQLSKEYQTAINTLKIIQQMASIVIGKGKNIQKWQKIAESAYIAESDLLINANAKLVLSLFILNI